MTYSDVTVVGCGPAGLSSAITCAQYGLKVTIIEYNTKLVSRPGESLLPGIEPILKQLGIHKEFLSSDIIKHKGNWVKWGGEITFIPFGGDDNSTWTGFQTFRPNFDHLLLDKALDMGVNVIWSAKTTKPISENNRIVGIDINSDRHYSSYVIDATGIRNWLCKRLELKIDYYSDPLIAYFGYVKGSCNKDQHLPCIIADKHGWIWTAKINEQLYQWVRLFFDKKSIEPNWLPSQFSGMKRMNHTRGSDVTWRRVSIPAGYGYFIVGDAATVLDPASSHGIQRAIMSGMMAAHMISKISEDKSREDQAILEYSRWVREWFLHDVKKLKGFYSNHPSPPKWINQN